MEKYNTFFVQYKRFRATVMTCFGRRFGSTARKHGSPDESSLSGKTQNVFTDRGLPFCPRGHARWDEPKKCHGGVTLPPTRLSVDKSPNCGQL